jgi:hypothetical protein
VFSLCICSLLTSDHGRILPVRSTCPSATCHLPQTESFSPGPEPSSQGRPASAIRPQTTPAEQIASGTFGRSSSWTYSLLQLKRSRTSSRMMQNERQLWCRPPKSRHVDARTYALQPMWSDHPGSVRRAVFDQPPDARPLSRHSNPVIVPSACLKLLPICEPRCSRYHPQVR